LDKVEKYETISNQTPKLYRDLADWYPLLTPVDDYAEEAAFYAVADRIPRVYPWMNEPVGGMLDVWK